MSYGQFSDKPLPTEKRCPYCGAVMPASATACWMCLEEFAVKEGVPPGQASQRAYAEALAGESAAWAVFGVVAILLTLAMALETPGVLIVLVVIAVPALVRTLAYDTSAAPGGGPSFLLVFLNSLGVATVVGLASFIAFFATCFVICLGGLGVGALNQRGSEDTVFMCSIGGGVVVGLIVAGLLFRRFWPRKG